MTSFTHQSRMTLLLTGLLVTFAIRALAQSGPNQAEQTAAAVEPIPAPKIQSPPATIKLGSAMRPPNLS